MDRVDSRVFVGQVVTAVTAADWDDEMLDVAETLQLDVGFNHEDPEWSWTEDELLEMEEISRELEASRQLMPSWGVLFGFVGGFKCATFGCGCSAGTNKD